MDDFLLQNAVHLEGELWRTHSDFGDDYEFSSRGRVRSWRGSQGRRSQPLVLTHRRSSTGSRQVNLMSPNGKQVTRSLAKLILEAFDKPHPPGIQHPVYLDGDRSNLALENLAWRQSMEIPLNAPRPFPALDRCVDGICYHLGIPENILTTALATLVENLEDSKESEV